MTGDVSERATSVVWFRDDLRVADNPALHEAVLRGDPIVCVYVLDDESPGIRPIGGASRWWLHHSLEALGESLRDVGLTLTLRRGPAREVVTGLVDEVGATRVLWNRRYGEVERGIDGDLKASLREAGVEAESSQGSLLAEPWTVLTGQGGWYKVFTPFYRAVMAKPTPRHPLAAPTKTDGLHHREVASDALGDWGLLPAAPVPDWAGGLRERWRPGEAGAAERMETFLTERVSHYVADQDLPAEEGTSMLSPHLRWGEISPFQFWHALDGHRARASSDAEGAAAVLRQLIWREFSYHLLFHLPSITTENMRSEFDRFPWAEVTDDELERWQQGDTGIPLVDAGMRELWQTGIMHNRVRMVVASFLVKNLRVDWRVGEAWFWDTLVDADPAANALNWQWVAGSGPDAAPYFRIFNPELQASKFDKHGSYVNRYVPEAGTPAYPEPMVDLKESRRAALDAYATIR
nr:deoxyribodipyrimidine photo-lyase [Herbiconiux flava]